MVRENGKYACGEGITIEILKTNMPVRVRLFLDKRFLHPG
jgi:hypothetical protein